MFFFLIGCFCKNSCYLFIISHLFLMNKNYRLIDEIYQQANSMFKNILISIILSNFATSTLQKSTEYTYNNI